MSHFATALSAGFIATVLVSGTAFVPTPAEAATGSGMALKMQPLRVRQRRRTRRWAGLRGGDT